MKEARTCISPVPSKEGQCVLIAKGMYVLTKEYYEKFDEIVDHIDRALKNVYSEMEKYRDKAIGAYKFTIGAVESEFFSLIVTNSNFIH